MAYFIRPVERDLLPDGHDWLLLRDHSSGDMHFFVTRDADAVELSRCALERIIANVVEHQGLVPLRLVV